MVEGKKSINFLRGILYLSPALILMAIFTFYPLFNTFIISFKEEYNYMTGKHAEWGFANYAKLFATGNVFSQYTCYCFCFCSFINYFIAAYCGGTKFH